MIEKLQKVGLLITLVCTIGGGFYTWGTFNQRRVRKASQN